MKHLKRGLAAIASLALTAALCAVGAEPAAALPTSRTAPQGHGTCTPTDPELLRQGTAWTCIKLGPAPASAVAAAPARARAGNNPGADQCLKDDQGDIPSIRTAYCTKYLAEYVTIGEDNKANGHAQVLVLAAAAMNSLPKAAWAEEVRVYTLSMTPNIAYVTLQLSSTCSGQCTAGPLAWGGNPVQLKAGQAREDGQLSYSSSVGKGFDTMINIYYHINGTIKTTTGTGVHRNTSLNWFGPTVRCDDKVGQWAGCIVNGHTANVTFHRSKYKGAAIAYEWAQIHLLSHPGTPGNLLNRWYVDPLDPKAKNRRALTCDRAPYAFPHGATGIPKDSCDEYPFAKTTQGGNPGQQCIDITPREVGGVWDVANVQVDRGTPPNAPCIRAHVNEDDNELAGTEYGNAVLSDRIYEGEPFQVIIDP
ncbi:hypothetical protein ADK52_03510 [Streptomyces sp. WM6372]|uniref:NucA/NucB deoxyribonuclease domain-containing protein n=1 Tax=Streptomyces sp. WM6372 TaxID=1415555 RepID=UPI0006AE5101|nr:hypothetical protein [Streptomyces sp. WM6372]KOU31261.1 hypothetical protein ADK52_03510 [Streptomyces sp. WM6372]